MRSTEQCERPERVDGTAAADVRDSARPAIAFGPAALLALQRSHGNRAVTRAVLQRRKSHKNWAVAATDERRKEVDRAGKKRWKGSSTLHHMISKVVLDAILVDLDEALRSKDPDLSEAAREFNSALTKAARAAGLPDNIDRAKQLWNIPFNLVAGPGRVANNPGEGFDASYRQVVDKDDVPRFVETDVSTHLRAVERHYREGRRETAGGRGLTAEAWHEMAKAFTAATKAADEAQGAHNVSLQPEQWFAYEGAKAETWIRSGARRYPGPDLGLKFFPPAVRVPANAAAPAPVDLAVTSRGGRKRIRVQMPVARVQHTCERHTYIHFTGDLSDCKAINTFFADRATDDRAVSALVAQALPDIAAAIGRHIADAALDIEEFDPNQGKDLNLPAVETSAGPLYVKAGFDWATFDDQPQQEAGAPSSRRKKRGKGAKAEALPAEGWLVTIKTVAPDGPNADAYTRDELIDLMGTLQRPVILEDEAEEDEEDEDEEAADE